MWRRGSMTQRKFPATNLLRRQRIYCDVMPAASPAGRLVLIDLIALPYQYVYRFPTAEGASTLSPKAADSAAMARQPVQ